MCWWSAPWRSKWSPSTTQACQCGWVFAAYGLASLVPLGYVAGEMWWPGRRGEWEGSWWWLAFVGAEGWLWLLGLALLLLTSCSDPGAHRPLPTDDPETIAALPAHRPSRPSSPAPSPHGPWTYYGDRTDDWAALPPSPSHTASLTRTDSLALGASVTPTASTTSRARSRSRSRSRTPKRMQAGTEQWKWPGWPGPDPRDRTVFVRSLEMELKFCRSCGFVRTPRTTHCSACDFCVESKDHHCPWMGNCVARRNYRYFLGFLSVCVAHLGLTLGFLTAVMVLRSGDIVSVLWLTCAVLALLCLAFGWMVGRLLSFHLAYAVRGLTTKEDVELPRAHSLRFPETNPFHHGSTAANLRAVFCGPVFPSLSSYAGSQKLPNIRCDSRPELQAESLTIELPGSETETEDLGQPLALPGPSVSIEPVDDHDPRPPTPLTIVTRL